MKRKNKMVGLWILVALLSGCAGPKPDSKIIDGDNAQSASSAGAMGRYMETIYPYAEEINRNGGVNWLDDGSLTLIDYNSGLYRSLDDGQSWNREDTSWYPMLEGVYCLSAVMGPDGTVAATCSGEMSEVVKTAYGKPVAEDWEGNYCVFSLPDGTDKVVDFGFSQEDGSCISSFVFKEDGRLFAKDMQGRVYEVDIEKESLRELFMAERAVGYLSFSGEILMAVGYDQLYLYDLEKEVLLPSDATVDAFIKQVLADGSVSYTSGGYPLAVIGSDEPDAIYLACQDGMYRHILNGSMMEQVIDGALSIFGDSYISIYQMRALENQEFLVAFSPSVGMVRYTFNEDVPAMPDKELQIYSLEENHSVRQAVTAYKRAHTDVYVRYEVGLGSDNSLTAEDAIKKLNTQILAGEGPDVLVLDGLPLDTYQEKGMLLDIHTLFQGLKGEEQLFENIVKGFTEENGSIYAMPMGVRIPLLAGDGGRISQAEDLESLVAEVERLRSDYPEGGLFGIYDAEAFLRLFGSVSSSAWVDKEGGMDAEAVKEFLTLTQKMYDLELAGAVPKQQQALQAEAEELASYGIDVLELRANISDNVLYLPMGYAQIAAGASDGIQLDLDCVTSLLRIDDSLDYRVFQGQSKNLFIPVAMVGISAKSTETEDAKAFVKLMFESETQQEIYDGYPVNRTAYQAHFAFLEENQSNGSMTLQKTDDTEQEFELYWPNQEEQQKFTAFMESLTTPALTNDYLCELVYSEGTKVLEGEVSVEHAATEIVKKAAIYLAE